MNRAEFQQLAELRLVEVKALLDQSQWSGAYDLAGYAVECGLKACIALLTKADDFPDKVFAQKCYTHDLESLLELAKLDSSLKSDAATNANLAKNWNTAKDWTEASRYVISSEAAAKEIFEAIADPTDGVHQWIKVRW